jgi:hypothetical protein
MPDKSGVGDGGGGSVVGVDVLGTAGSGLELLGIAVAAVGLDDLSRELFPESPLPHRVFARGVRRLWRRALGKRTTVTKDLGLAWEVETAQPIRPLKSRPRPATGAPVEAWAEYFDSRLDNVTEQLGWEAIDRMKGDDSLARKIAEDAQERRRADDELREQVKGWVAGQGGRGLVLAFVGLSVTAVGLVFQIVDATR